jgi:chaperonin cofactor prefoldin
MSRFNFLGHPTVDEINDLNGYLDVKYDLIDEQKAALQHEIDNLKITLGKYLTAESVAAKETRKKPKHFTLTSYVKNPIPSEDRTYFDIHRYASVETGALVDTITRPWIDHIKKDQENIDYKIRKLKYLIEQKSIQIQLLDQLQAELKDVV